MNKDDLKQCLRRERERWSAKSYDGLVAELQSVVAYSVGEGSASYQVEVELLECEAEYVHVLVGIDDGGWRAFKPLSTDFLVYRDGRVEKAEGL